MSSILAPKPKPRVEQPAPIPPPRPRVYHPTQDTEEDDDPREVIIAGIDIPLGDLVWFVMKLYFALAFSGLLMAIFLAIITVLLAILFGFKISNFLSPH